MQSYRSKGMNEIAKEIHANAKAHGWWDEERPFSEVVALCHSELSEALEADRAGEPMLRCQPCCAQYDDCPDCAGVGKPEGVAVEMIDCIIRILDWCAREDVDVDHILNIKMRYNETRPRKHGKKY